MTAKIWIGVVLVVGGAVLALFFRDLEFFWFRGGPLGLLLVIVGAFELFEGYRAARPRTDVRE